MSGNGMKMFSKLSVKNWPIIGQSKVEKQIEKLNARVNALSDLLYYHEKCFHKEGAAFASLVQEEAWGGIHGYRYVMHHLPENWQNTRVPIWEKILKNTPEIKNVFEYGSNIGANLEAIRLIRPDIIINGIEINPLAVRICKERGFLNVDHDSIINYSNENKFDLVFSRGVLIHIPPKHLSSVYESMYKTSNKYVLIWENYSEKPMHLEKYSKIVNENYTLGDSEGFQFWRDFAGDFHEQHKDLKIIASSKDRSRAKKGEVIWTLFSK